MAFKGFIANHTKLQLCFSDAYGLPLQIQICRNTLITEELSIVIFLLTMNIITHTP